MGSIAKLLDGWRGYVISDKLESSISNFQLRCQESRGTFRNRFPETAKVPLLACGVFLEVYRNDWVIHPQSRAT
jgi:hypothetical protein